MGFWEREPCFRFILDEVMGKGLPEKGDFSVKPKKDHEVGRIRGQAFLAEGAAVTKVLRCFHPGNELISVTGEESALSIS